MRAHFKKYWKLYVCAFLLGIIAGIVHGPL